LAIRSRPDVLGEAPGRDEDLQGKPFVGRAGQLPHDIIKAMKLTRDDVDIANVIKCVRPRTATRSPTSWRLPPWIRRQIEIIQPKVIVTLDVSPAEPHRKGLRHFVRRGQWLDYDGIRSCPPTTRVSAPKPRAKKRCGAT